MTVTHHASVEQGSEEWTALRCGLLTASEMKLILTPTLKTASNDKERAHVNEIAAQRISRYVEPHYVGDHMLRGHEDEIEARLVYEREYAPVTTVGFITNDRWGFTLGYSPDGLVGTNGAIECKSRLQKFQVQTIVDGEVPPEHVLQLQTGLLVSEREWCDFVSYSGGMPMATIRVYPDPVVQEAILAAATAFEAAVARKIASYQCALTSGARLVPTERKIEQEMWA